MKTSFILYFITIGALFTIPEVTNIDLSKWESIMNNASTGNTKEGNQTGTYFLQDPVTSLFFFDEKTGFALPGGSGEFYKTIDGAEHWERIYISGSLAKNLISIFFVNRTSGFLCGDGFLKTIDGGKTWNRVANVPQRATYKNLHFVNSLNGYVLCQIWGGSCNLLKTTNGGNTWLLVGKPITTSYVNSMSIINSNTIIAVGDVGIYRTTDGGLTWTSKEGGFYRSSISFPTSHTGFVTGQYGITTMTTDGGETWKIIAETESRNRKNDFKYLYRGNAIVFINSLVGFIVGDNGTILSTSDGGNTWQKKESGVNNHLCSIFFVNRSIGYIGGARGMILKSTNGGNTWTQQRICSPN